MCQDSVFNHKYSVGGWYMPGALTSILISSFLQFSEAGSSIPPVLHSKRDGNNFAQGHVPYK